MTNPPSDQADLPDASALDAQLASVLDYVRRCGVTKVAFSVKPPDAKP